jgi:1,3-beta-glucanosyltransferase GAS5
MKSYAFVSALTALSGIASATPTPTEPEQPHKRSSIPTVTASGNGMATWESGHGLDD